MGWEFVIAMIIQIVSAVITASLQPKPEQPAVGSMDVPMAEDGATISVVFGTVRVKDANVIWYGDPTVDPIRSGGGGKK